MIWRKEISRFRISSNMYLSTNILSRTMEYFWMDFVFRSVDISSTRVLSVVSKYKNVEEIHPKINLFGKGKLKLSAKENQPDWNIDRNSYLLSIKLLTLELVFQWVKSNNASVYTHCFGVLNVNFKQMLVQGVFHRAKSV